MVAVAEIVERLEDRLSADIVLDDERVSFEAKFTVGELVAIRENEAGQANREFPRWIRSVGRSTR